MNALFAFCTIVMAGAVSPGFGDTDSPAMAGGVVAELREPIAPARENLPVPSFSQQSRQQSTSARPARTTNEGVKCMPAMPVPPTDPRAFARNDLPLPPTMNDSRMSSNTGRIGAGLRGSPAGLAENAGRRLPSQKPFENYRPSPPPSPYLLLDAPSNNGTVNAYTAYVRPAQEQQRASQQQFDDAAGGTENAGYQPAPVFPPAFQNYGSYYPSYATGR